MTRPLLPLLLIAPSLAQISETASLKDKRYSEELADAYERIDPSKDGWATEKLGEEFSARLKVIAKDLLKAEFPEGTLTTPLRPTNLKLVHNGEFSVSRSPALPEEFAPFKPPVLDGFKTKVKVTRINGLSCQALITFKKPGHQINAVWNCTWQDDLQLKSLQVIDYEEVSSPVLLKDVTESVLGDTEVYHDHLLRSTDHWRLRLPRDFGLDAAANHGLAIGDVNGDGLEDLYLCQQGGLPNRLFLQNPDGSLRDFSEESQTNYLDYCVAALLVDLDNDGDKDLVISQDFKILFLDNLDGKGHFELAFGSSTKAQSFSLSAADFDQDGKLDVYICGYNPSFSAARAGALGEPVPFHDANNGGENMLWRNLGNWQFEDVASKVHLDQVTTRFSFAASWQDYDLDGDLDLYVANDFGRNCLFQNQGKAEDGLPRFRNVAGRLNIEDTSAGMSTNWGDFNRDGHPDLYVSNMFSSAGNRITFQEQFKTTTDNKVRSSYQRMARGNTLFTADGKGGFKDVSLDTRITMARWCWGSTFIDLNNDGWLDILAANGFITAEDTGDL